jgi:adenine-specific DNA-methyltransferase
MRDVLYAATGDRPQALILDYFAGSGTTLHATWLLNAEDGGTRQCFIVTNNEVEKAERARLAAAGHFEGDREFEQRGIFKAVTRPRLTAALKGERANGEPVEGRYLTGRDYSAGFEENIEFFELDFLDPIDVQLGLSADALAPTLWLMAGGVGERTPIDPTALYHLPPEGPYAIVFDPAGVAEVAERLTTRPDVRRVFIVAGSDDAYAAVAERLPNGIETTMLYRSYLDACRRVGESTR